MFSPSHKGKTSKNRFPLEITTQAIIQTKQPIFHIKFTKKNIYSATLFSFFLLSELKTKLFEFENSKINEFFKNKIFFINDTEQLNTKLHSKCSPLSIVKM